MRKFQTYDLDREREVSMADEGGVAAAYMEGEYSRNFMCRSPNQRLFLGIDPQGPHPIWLAALAVSVGLGVYVLGQKYIRETL